MTVVKKVGALRGIHPSPRLDGKPFLQLAQGWALAADTNQWIVCSARTRHGEMCWQPRCYIGSNKAVLRRVVRELGIEVRPESNAAPHVFLRLPPHEFLEWQDQAGGAR